MPIISVVACLLLLRRPGPAFSPKRREELFLLAVVGSTGVLIQYPFAAFIYFCYCAPLLFLALNAVLSAQDWRSNTARGGMLCFYSLFAILFMNAGHGTDPRSPISSQRHKLPIERSGLQLHAYQAKQYSKLVSLIQKHSATGSFIYAAPDCPEVYFLANRRNPTKTMYDFFDDPKERSTRIIELLEKHKVNVIVINTKPLFSQKIQGELLGFLSREFPRRWQIENLVVGLRGKPENSASSSVLAPPPSIVEDPATLPGTDG